MQWPYYSWGQWSAWQRCPSNTYAYGFRLRMERYWESKDDTALNAIRVVLPIQELSYFRHNRAP